MYYTPSGTHLKPTEGVCVPVLHFVANHPNFDIYVLALILFDGIIISLEHLATSEVRRKIYMCAEIFWMISKRT